MRPRQKLAPTLAARLFSGQAIRLSAGEVPRDGFALRLDLRIASHLLHGDFEFLGVVFG
jgi:hypothetical protein